MEERALLMKLQVPELREAAFNDVVIQYQEVLYWHVRKIVFDHDDANDVIQNAFIKAWRNIDSFRGESKLKTWLYRIATNEALTFLKQKNRRSAADVEDLHNSTALSDSGFSGPGGDDILAKLHKAVISLPEKQRIVFNLKYFDEMKYEEIAQVLGGTVGSLKASFHHAVKKVEEFLQND